MFPDGRLRRALPAVLLLAAFGCGFAVVRPTNFAGFDEWLILWLASHGVVDFPYSNRPLNVWPIPGLWLRPNGFFGFHLAHGAYLALTGLAAAGIARRLAPGRERTATLAGLAAACLAPGDMARLSTVQMTLNSGSTFGATLALLLLVEAARRSSPWLLLAATASGFAVVRSYEATLSVLAAGPLLLFAAGRRPPWWLLAGFWGGMSLAAALAAAPHVMGAPAMYQTSVWGIDVHPVGVLRRILHQYGWHLGPLLAPGPAELTSWAALTAAFFAVLAVLASVDGGDAAGPAPGRVALAGLLLSLAAYAPFALSPGLDAPHRAQMAAAPWIGLTLAACAEAVPRRAPLGWRPPLTVLLAAWLVLVGTGRTVAMQRAWDGRSLYAPQRKGLQDLVRQAPALEPHTLVVALQQRMVWPSSFGFRHAIQYLYGDDVTGHAVGGLEHMYPTRVDAQGVHTDTWAVVQGPWGVAPTFHRYDELVVVEIAAGGALTLLSEWPADRLGALPAGARYAPEPRIRHGAPARAEHAVLDR